MRCVTSSLRLRISSTMFGEAAAIGVGGLLHLLETPRCRVPLACAPGKPDIPLHGP